MPLVDDSENLLDRELMADVANHFTTRNGLIIDKNGMCWYLWRADALGLWWRLFEEIIDAPMGRRMVNSACDEEEDLLKYGVLDYGGIFRKRKTLSALQHRWKIHGWGVPYLSPPSFDSIGLKPLFAGILQADFERINSKRYRMLWDEKTEQTTLLTLEENDVSLPSAKSSSLTVELGQPLVKEIEKGWNIDGIGHFLLPVGIFRRLHESSAGMEARVGEDERASWPDSWDDGSISIALAAKKLFIAGEDLFLAADHVGWVDCCKALFGEKGLSTPLSVKPLDNNGGIELKYSEIKCIPMTLGYLAGAWVRCEGRPVKLSLRVEDDFQYISLQSRYAVA